MKYQLCKLHWGRRVWYKHLCRWWM